MVKNQAYVDKRLSEFNDCRRAIYMVRNVSEHYGVR
jgi:hypothetical protein